VKPLARTIASGLYSGYSPVAPGTVGSLVGLVFYLGLASLGSGAYGLICVLAFFVGVWASGEAETSYGRDGRRIVIDEIVGMWVTLLGLPPRFSLVVTGFFIFRLFDILKPFPAHRSQRLRGGWGVMMDDLLAGVYANLALRVLYYLVASRS